MGLIQILPSSNVCVCVCVLFLMASKQPELWETLYRSRESDLAGKGSRGPVLLLGCTADLACLGQLPAGADGSWEARPGSVGAGSPLPPSCLSLPSKHPDTPSPFITSCSLQTSREQISLLMMYMRRKLPRSHVTGEEGDRKSLEREN